MGGFCALVKRVSHIAEFYQQRSFEDFDAFLLVQCDPPLGWSQIAEFGSSDPRACLSSWPVWRSLACSCCLPTGVLSFLCFELSSLIRL